LGGEGEAREGREPQEEEVNQKWLIGLVALFVPLMVLAEGSNAKGRGALVIVNEAPVFKKSTGEERVHVLHRWDTVVGNKSFGMGLELWDFVEKDGRVRVAYLVAGEKRPMKKGWMRPGDLSMFVYADCGVQTDAPTMLGGKPLESPWPWSAAGTWTLCFQEARDAKLKELQADSAKAGKSQTETRPAEPEKKPE
jgi:hypothetical protein